MNQINYKVTDAQGEEFNFNQEDFIKFLNKQFNEPCRKGYMKIVFNNMKDESSDNEPINNTK